MIGGNVSKGGCQHRCNNTIGTFVCSCNDGFALTMNERTCEGMNMLKTVILKKYLTFYYHIGKILFFVCYPNKIKIYYFYNIRQEYSNSFNFAIMLLSSFYFFSNFE